jgi:SAM-dependent methyltransferase
MRYLLAHSRPSSLVRAFVTPTSLDDAEWRGVGWPRSDRWLYAFATRLLWEHARRRDTFGVLDNPEPAIGRPLPVHWRGRLISQDLANAALEVTAIGRALSGRRPQSILEVGAGYGRTAYALLNAFPDASYTIVDIEPALSIARWYLGQLFAPERLHFLPPDTMDELPRGSFDLVVSISSLHEMRIDQVERYLELFDHVAMGGTVYLKQWSRWKNPADHVTLEFADYPIPIAWSPLFDTPAPVQTNFREAAWDVPAAT